MAEIAQVLATDGAAPAGPPPSKAGSAAAQGKHAKVSDLMSPPVGVFSGTMTVGATIKALRQATKTAFITYAYVTDDAGRLTGVVVMREMLLAKRSDTLASIMLREPFALRQDMPLEQALQEALGRHYPVYPVVDAAGVLTGLVRGEALFANRAIAISAQAGSMVGVEKEERLGTSMRRSLLLRHPWLQVNLVTAAAAAAVVSIFAATISQLVILAVFLPLIAGQTGNTGNQALAVALRGLTLGDVKPGSERSVVVKEAKLGFLNGALVGITAGIGISIYAALNGERNPAIMGLVVFLSLAGACTLSGIAGALIPFALKRLGADPATASAIFLTTASDIASMGMFLSLATLLLI
jgi:magnesium transporter